MGNALTLVPLPSPPPPLFVEVGRPSRLLVVSPDNDNDDDDDDDVVDAVSFNGGVLDPLDPDVLAGELEDGDSDGDGESENGDKRAATEAADSSGVMARIIPLGCPIL